MLLLIEALLLILAALGQDHRAAVEGQTYQLDMANNSVDDRYYGCTEEMAKLVKREYLKKELSNSIHFKKAWEMGKKNVSRSWFWKKFTREHKIAIYVYTQDQTEFKIYDKFNSDTRYGKQNYTVGQYKWYSLHFLLTHALHILKAKSKERCFITYRGTNSSFNGTLNTVIRFGSFTSTTLDYFIARRFGSKSGSCFEIHTCEGANITKYSVLPYEEEVLVPPYEMFNITEIKKGKNLLLCEIMYVLNSTGIKSDLNCALFNKPNLT